MWSGAFRSMARLSSAINLHEVARFCNFVRDWVSLVTEPTPRDAGAAMLEHETTSTATRQHDFPARGASLFRHD
jgi:hypothetical protein